MPRVAGSTILSGGGLRASPFGRVEVVTCLWIVCALATLAVSQQHSPFYTQGRYGKREASHAQPLAFFSGSRYGRGGVTNPQRSKSESKLLEVSPRVDRFFLGSRYGKRGLSDDRNNPQRVQQREPPSGISSLKRYEEALGYFNQVERDDRNVRTIDNTHGQKSSDKIDSNNGNNEEIPVDIPNEDKPDNFW